MPAVLLSLLKVRALPDGRLVRRRSTHRRSGALAPVDENWWRDVLLDPRATWRFSSYVAADSPVAFHRLDQQPAKIKIVCACGRSTTLDLPAA